MDMNGLLRPLPSQMHALKTRGPYEIVVDMLFAAAFSMAIPFVAMRCRTWVPSIIRFFMEWVRWGWRPKFVRTIDYEKQLSRGFGVEEDRTDENQRNNILHKAILLYIGQVLELRYPTAQVLLSAVKETGTREKGEGSYGPTQKVYGTTAEQLKAYSVNISPPSRDWVSLGNSVFFYQTIEITPINSADNHSAMKKKVSFTFVSREKDGDLRIQSFIDAAFLWYCKAMECTEDQHRYYYTPLTEGAGGASILDPAEETEGFGARGMGSRLPGHDGAINLSRPSGEQRYKRYRLGDEKSFDSLFFPEKELLLKILHNFQHKTGKYGVKGYPNKLGLLLHGPPGTGKSSLIKALALHTGRHIIDVPLARIKTNQDLMDIMFDQHFPVDKMDLPVTLAIENVIFVMEDIDATSPIVRSRDHAPRDTQIPAEGQDKQTYGSRNAKQPAGGRQDGTTERAVTAASQKGECPAVGESSSMTSAKLNVPATATTTTSTDATTTAVAVEYTPTVITNIISTSSPVASVAIPTDTTSTSASPDGRSTPERPLLANAAEKTSVFPAQVTGLEGGERDVKHAVEDKGIAQNDDDGAAGVEDTAADESQAPTKEFRGEACHVRDGSAGINKEDDAGMEEVTEKGWSRGGRPESAMEAALLQLTVEAASKNREHEERKKAYATMTGKLDLAGVLNVLDGVVDSPGRIVIMTTNFPEALDAALIRPGRIDKKLHLDYMKYPAAKEMVCHFFEVDHLTADQDKRLRNIFDETQPLRGRGIGGGGSGGRGGGTELGGGNGRKITPAVVEQLAGEFDNVDDFLVALQTV